jgi:hypothetical protein
LIINKIPAMAVVLFLIVLGVVLFPLWRADVRHRGPKNWIEKRVFKNIQPLPPETEEEREGD